MAVATSPIAATTARTSPYTSPRATVWSGTVVLSLTVRTTDSTVSATVPVQLVGGFDVVGMPMEEHYRRPFPLPRPPVQARRAFSGPAPRRSRPGPAWPG